MKKSFRFPVLFAMGICIVCIVSSCNVALIHITGSDITTGNLVLTDSAGNPADTIEVIPEQSIKWKIKEKSGVSKVTKIFRKSGSQTVLEDPAHKKFLSKNWKAKVDDAEELIDKFHSSSVNGYYYFREDYYIKWRRQNDTTTYTYDPRIKVKSRVAGGD